MTHSYILGWTYFRENKDRYPDVWQKAMAWLNTLQHVDDPCPEWLERAIKQAEYQWATGKPAVTSEPTIWYHGEQAYSTDGVQCQTVSGDEHKLLQRFVNRDVSLGTADLTSCGLSNPAQTVSKLITRFGVTTAIKRPGKSKRGYRVTVRTLPNT